MKLKVNHLLLGLLICDWLLATPWTIQPMEFSRPEHCSVWLFPSPGDFPNPGMAPDLPHCRWIYQLSHRGSPHAQQFRLMGPRPWAQYSQGTGLVSLQHVGSLDQGLNLCPLHLQVDSDPLHITREVPHLHQHSTQFVTSFRKRMCMIWKSSILSQLLGESTSSFTIREERIVLHKGKKGWKKS